MSKTGKSVIEFWEKLSSPDNALKRVFFVIFVLA